MVQWVESLEYPTNVLTTRLLQSPDLDADFSSGFLGSRTRSNMLRLTCVLVRSLYHRPYYQALNDQGSMFYKQPAAELWMQLILHIMHPKLSFHIYFYLRSTSLWKQHLAAVYTPISLTVANMTSNGNKIVTFSAKRTLWATERWL